MPFILETIVATRNADGSFHVAPYGLIRADAEPAAEGSPASTSLETAAHWILAPFRPSPAIDNLARHPFAVASCPADMRVVAGHVTGRRDWPMLPADKVDGRRLADAYGHMELEVVAFADDATRPRFTCRVVHEATHTPFLGFNRAQAAVLEAAILSTRLHMLPRDKIDTEMAYLKIAIDKTAGPAEAEAFGWIADKIAAHFG